MSQKSRRRDAEQENENSWLCVDLVGWGAAFLKLATFRSCRSKIPKDDISNIRSGLSEVGVEPKVQDRLINKLERGIVWDSLNGSSKPVKKTIEQLSGETVERLVYADGSVVVSETQRGIDLPSNVAMPASKITGCLKLKSKSGWSRWGDCKSKVNLVIVQMSFMFNYSLKKGKQARIDKIFNHSNFCTCIVDRDRTKITRKYTDGAAPATARASVRYTIGPWKGVGVMSDGWSQININKNGKLWTTHN